MATFREDEEHECDPGVPPWVVTFGDMMSLLLTFFVLLLSFSEIDRVAFAQIMGSLKEAFGVQTVTLMVEPMSQSEKKPIPQEGNAAGEQLLDRLNSILPGAFAGGRTGMDNGTGTAKVTVSVPGRLLFDLGDATLNPDFVAKLKEIASLMQDDEALTLEVFGHTDDLPISTERFHNNWELSGARAASVITFLIDECGISPQRLTAIGYADSRPIAPNDTPENRDKNRRVEFQFIADDSD